jgi:uncharacterized protein (TIGR03435 family)
LSAASAVFGQSFEVASVKVHEEPMYRLGVTTEGKRLTADYANVRTLMMFAFDVQNFRVTGAAPITQDEVRWDIQAKAEGGAAPTRAEFQQMMQALLAGRFHLEAHRETREIPVFALMVGKNGPKFQASGPGADPMGLYSRKGRNNVITLPKATARDLVDAIESAFLDRPVVDRTELTGTYNIKLTYTPNTRANRESDPDLSDINVLQAVEEQLGLRLEARREPIEMLVVDRVERPSGNE